jgi:hypothetical protein
MRTGHGHAYKDPHRVKMREVAGVFRARDAMDEAVTALLGSGFDRADIDVMVGAEARGRLRGAKIAAEELPDLPTAPRQHEPTGEWPSKPQPTINDHRGSERAPINYKRG